MVRADFLDIYLALLGFFQTVLGAVKSAKRCRRLARYVDEALVAAERDVESSPDEETRYARHRKYFRRTGLEWLECNQKRVITIDDETPLFVPKLG